MIAYGHHTLAHDEQHAHRRARRRVHARRSRAATPTRASRRRSTAARPGTKTVRDLFLKYPNVIAYVAGHTHDNRIDLFRKGSSGLLADQHRLARRLAAAEPADRGDGQPRRHALALRHDARPGRAGGAPAPGTAAGLTHDQFGSLSRVLAWNDPQRAKASRSAARRTATWSRCCATRAIAGTPGMLLATLLAAAAWTAPVPLDPPDYGATASGAFGGSAVGGEFEATASIARRNGNGSRLVRADHDRRPEREGRRDRAADSGEALVATVRRHRPTRRIPADDRRPRRHARAVHTIADPVAFGDPAGGRGRR